MCWYGNLWKREFGPFKIIYIFYTFDLYMQVILDPMLVWKFVEMRVWAVQDYLLVGAYLTFVNSADSVDLCGQSDQRDIFRIHFFLS